MEGSFRVDSSRPNPEESTDNHGALAGCIGGCILNMFEVFSPLQLGNLMIDSEPIQFGHEQIRFKCS